MKLFWIKNRLLLATLAAVLVLGGAFWGALNLFTENSMQELYIRTAQAEAEATAAPSPEQTEGTEPMPTPTMDPQTEKAEEIRVEAYVREWRFASIIPRIDNSVPFDSKTWQQGDDPLPELKAKALQQVQAIYSAFFGRDINTADMSVVRFTDTAGYRPNILRITNEKNTMVCVLLEEDLSPLAMSTIQYSPQKMINLKQDAARVAEVLGTQLDETKSTLNRGGGRGRVGLSSYAVAFEDGRWVSLAYTENCLMGLKIHSDDYSMQEGVCFQADIRYNEKVTQPVAPANFEQGDLDHIQEGDMTPDQVELMYRTFLSAANSRASERRKVNGKSVAEYDYTITPGCLTYYLDKSGYRENYYRIDNSFVTMEIAAKSGYIVRATCASLYNLDPELDLSHIEYEQMGGAEYTRYVKYVAEQTFGKDNVKSVEVNAVYDGAYCTVDPYMMDGSWYEFSFAYGRLTGIQYFAYDGIARDGWAADSLYVNTITGEEFYQEW